MNTNTPIPAGFRERLDYNADFALDWHDPDEARDGYQLKWIGKDYARLQSGTAPLTVIVPDAERNALAENAGSGNIFLTGDNIEVLKHLQNAYNNKVDMIYIDPPYNTGKEFVYSDTFDFSDEQLKDMLGITEKEIKRLHNINGKSSHSAWLTFMYPRLRLASKLLKDTGVIFISIDDNEQANLKLLCDEVFCEGNFVADIIWQKNFAPKNDNKYISISTDYILCYANCISIFQRNLLPRTVENDNTYKNPDNDNRGVWTSGSMLATSFTKSGVFEIEAPNGKKHLPPAGRCWRFSKEKIKQLQADSRIWWGDDCNNVPRIKRFLTEMPDGIVPQNLLLWQDVGSNQDGNKDMRDLFAGSQIFDFPKGIKLIQHLLKIGTNKSALILDFFAGSGTTAQAVMQLNAEDGGSRRWILCTLDEPTNPDSEARKAGYETIDEIARERIKRAAAKIRQEAGLNGGNLDLGFKHFRIKPPSALTIDKITEFDPAKPPPLIADDMAAEMGGIDVILATWLTADGYQLTYKPEVKNIAGFNAHYVDNSMLYIIEQGWGKKQTKELLNLVGTHKLNLNTIIVYGYSFTLESIRELEINVAQSLNKQVSIEKRY